jgi:hypothetical protein
LEKNSFIWLSDRTIGYESGAGGRFSTSNTTRYGEECQDEADEAVHEGAEGKVIGNLQKHIRRQGEDHELPLQILFYFWNICVLLDLPVRSGEIHVPPLVQVALRRRVILAPISWSPTVPQYMYQPLVLSHIFLHVHDI